MLFRSSLRCPPGKAQKAQPAHTAGQLEDVAASPRSNWWASTEQGPSVLEAKPKFLGCGWGWGQGKGRGGRNVLRDPSLGGRQLPSHLQSHLLASRLSPRIPCQQSYCSHLCSASLGLPIPVGGSPRPLRPTGPTGRAPHQPRPTFLTASWKSPLPFQIDTVFSQL